MKLTDHNNFILVSFSIKYFPLALYSKRSDIFVTYIQSMPNVTWQVPPKIKGIRAEIRAFQYSNLGQNRSPIITSSQFEIQIANRRVNALTLDLELVNHASLKWLPGHIVKDFWLQRIQFSHMLRIQMLYQNVV